MLESKSTLREREREREGWKEKRSCSSRRSRDLLDSLEFFRSWDNKVLGSLQFFFTSYWEIQRPWIVSTWILMLTSDECWLVGFWIHSTTKRVLLCCFVSGYIQQQKSAMLLHQDRNWFWNHSTNESALLQLLLLLQD